jgi:lysophospholipase L1-like esterase
MPEQKLIPVSAEAFAQPLPNLAKQLAGKGWIKIVAIGSSSTAGEGGIVPYPTRLQAALRVKDPYKDRVIVLNRGIGGQEAPDEVKRFQTDVLDEKPALVIWQIGTNAVWQLPRPRDLTAVADAIADGLAQIARIPGQPTDVVLMDLQYVPALLTDQMIKDTRLMLSLIDEAAAAAAPKVNVFHRYDMMRKWYEIERRSFDAMVDPADVDRLHQSDYSTTRVAYELGEKIAAAAALAAA